MSSTTHLLPRQSGPRDRSRSRGPLSDHHILVVAERDAPAVAPEAEHLAEQLRADAGRVSVLKCVNPLTDLVGHRVTGRPDLVIGMLPGRGPALAAVRVAERMGSPLMVLVSHDGPSSWGEQGTLRRAARVVLTGEDLRERVLQAGVGADRIDLWHALLPGAGRAFRQLVSRTISDFATPAISTGGAC